MTEHCSDARERAELVFSKLQAPSSGRERAFEEINALRAAGAEKTQKLRELRLAKERQEREALTGGSAVSGPEAP